MGFQAIRDQVNAKFNIFKTVHQLEINVNLGNIVSRFATSALDLVKHNPELHLEQHRYAMWEGMNNSPDIKILSRIQTAIDGLIENIHFLGEISTDEEKSDNIHYNFATQTALATLSDSITILRYVIQKSPHEGARELDTKLNRLHNEVCDARTRLNGVNLNISDELVEISRLAIDFLTTDSLDQIFETFQTAEVAEKMNIERQIKLDNLTNIAKAGNTAREAFCAQYGENYEGCVGRAFSLAEVVVSSSKFITFITPDEQKDLGYKVRAEIDAAKEHIDMLCDDETLQSEALDASLQILEKALTIYGNHFAPAEVRQRPLDLSAKIKEFRVSAVGDFYRSFDQFDAFMPLFPEASAGMNNQRQLVFDNPTLKKDQNAPQKPSYFSEVKNIFSIWR